MRLKSSHFDAAIEADFRRRLFSPCKFLAGRRHAHSITARLPTSPAEPAGARATIAAHAELAAKAQPAEIRRAPTRTSYVKSLQKTTRAAEVLPSRAAMQNTARQPAAQHGRHDGTFRALIDIFITLLSIPLMRS